MSALSLMAAHEHKWVKVSEDDIVVISAHAIPGNEANVSRVIDSLHRTGADVVHGGDLARARLRSCVARRAQVHAEPDAAGTGSCPCTASTATWSTTPAWRETSGWPMTTSSSARTATSLTLGPNGIDVDRRAVPAGYLYVDGIVGDVGHGVLRDRRNLAEEGVVVVIVTVDATTGEVVTGPEIVTRGLGLRARGRGAARGGEGRGAGVARPRRPGRARPTSRRSAATPGVRSAGSSTSARSAGPAIIPVVMEV